MRIFLHLRDSTENRNCRKGVKNFAQRKIYVLMLEIKSFREEDEEDSRMT